MSNRIGGACELLRAAEDGEEHRPGQRAGLRVLAGGVGAVEEEEAVRECVKGTVREGEGREADAIGLENRVVADPAQGQEDAAIREEAELLREERTAGVELLGGLVPGGHTAPPP